MTNNKRPVKRTTRRERHQIRQCRYVVGLTLNQIAKAFDLTPPAINYIVKNVKKK